MEAVGRLRYRTTRTTMDAGDSTIELVRGVAVIQSPTGWAGHVEIVFEGANTFSPRQILRRRVRVARVILPRCRAVLGQTTGDLVVASCYERIGGSFVATIQLRHGRGGCLIAYRISAPR